MSSSLFRRRLTGVFPSLKCGIDQCIGAAPLQAMQLDNDVRVGSSAATRIRTDADGYPYGRELLRNQQISALCDDRLTT